MAATVDQLTTHLTQYRKALRAMMAYHDHSAALMGILDRGLSELLAPGEVEQADSSDYDASEEDRPEGATFEAWSEVKNVASDFVLEGYSSERPKRGAVFVQMFHVLDFKPAMSPSESMSVVLVDVSRSRIEGVMRKTKWGDLDELEYGHNVRDDKALKGGWPEVCANLKVYPAGITWWDSERPERKIPCDYAVGVYNVAELVDAASVQRVVLDDLKNLLERWRGSDAKVD